MAHPAAPRSKLYLADGYDLVRYYTHDMEIAECKEKKERGILILYALPDTKKLHLTEAQAYDVIWSTFHEIQKKHILPLCSTDRRPDQNSENRLMNWGFFFQSINSKQKCFNILVSSMDSFFPVVKKCLKQPEATVLISR